MRRIRDGTGGVGGQMVDVMAGIRGELKFPKLIGVKHRKTKWLDHQGCNFKNGQDSYCKELGRKYC